MIPRRPTQPLPLFDPEPKYAGVVRAMRKFKAEFDGTTYDATKDRARLTGQLARVLACMSDGKWRTLDEIAAWTGDSSVASVSSRVRDLRKPKFGGHAVERRRVGETGLFQYRLAASTGAANPGVVRDAATGDSGAVSPRLQAPACQPCAGAVDHHPKGA